MINVKDEVYAALAAVFDNVTDNYPEHWVSLPAVQYMEEDNKVVEYTDNQEQKAYVRYRIDVWDKKSTSMAAIAVDQAVAALGLKRTQCMDVEAPGCYKHKQLRYEMIIDVHTKRVYHNM